MYAIGFWVHVLCVYLSLAGFILRGVWMLSDSPLRLTKPAKILPHVVDTLLLLSALLLAIITSQYPFTHPWLTAKLFALLAYIGLGLVAFRFGANRAVRGLAFAAALLAFVYMLAVAYTRHPWPLGG